MPSNVVLKPEGFEDNLVFAEGEYEMMLSENE